MRTRLRWLIWGLAIPVVLSALLLVWFATVGFSVDAQRWRGEIAAQLSQRLGREIRLQGPIRLTLSPSPYLQVGDLRLMSGDQAWLSIGELRLGLSLMPWLRDRHLQITEFSGQRVSMRLRRDPEGRGNWEARTPAQALAPAATESTRAAKQPGSAPPSLSLAIDRFHLDDLRIDYAGADGLSHFFELASLRGSAPSGAPFTAEIKGSIEKRFPFELTLKGGELPALLAPPARTSGAVPSPPGWPLSVSLTFLGSAIQADGHLSTQGPRWRGEFDIGLGTPDLGEFEKLLGRELPRAGAAALAGRLTVGPDRVSLSGLSASFGQSAASGDLAWDLVGVRPRLSGRLNLPTLDARPFLAQESPDAAAPVRDLAQWYRELAQARLPLAGLKGVDADLELTVGNWLNLPGEVGEASLRIQLAEGRLRVPMHARIAGVRLDGDLLADASASPPSVELALGARDSPLGSLAELAFGLKGIQGALGGFSLRVAAQGEQVADLTRSLDLRLVITRGGMTYGNGDRSSDASPVAFGVQSLVVALPAGGALSMQAEGSLLDQPVTATVQGAPLTELIRGGSALRIGARSRSLQAALQGTVGDPDSAAGTDLRITLSAARIGDVMAWFRRDTPTAVTAAAPANRAATHLPLTLEGRARWQSGRWALTGGSVRVGRSEMSAELSQAGQPGLGRRGPVSLMLSAQSLDLAELESLLPPARPGDAGGATLDIPILPAKIDLSDTNLQVRIGRLEGTSLGWSDIRFDAQMRDGRLLASPFAARLLSTPFEGAVAFEVKDGQPQLELWLGSEQADLGAMLRQLKIAERIEATIGRLVVHGVARGRRLSDLLAHSAFTAELESGALTLSDRNTGAQARIALSRGSLKAAAGAPLSLELSGQLDGLPVALQLNTGTLTELVRTDQRLAFDLQAQAAGARLAMKGALARPLSDGTVDLSLVLEGDRVDQLSPLARVALPPWGPYSLGGRLSISPRGYEVSNLQLRVGSSMLRGKGSLDTRQRPALFDINLSAPSIQLDDFRLGQWWPFEQKPAAPAAAGRSVQALRASAADATGRAQRLLSAEVLQRQNATVLVQVDQVLSGRDRLGNGWLVARVEDGRADIGPVQVDVPGGRATFWLGYGPGVRDVDVYARAQVEDVDYGLLARRVRPESDLQGRFSLNLDLRARTPVLADAMTHGNGVLEFIVQPRNQGAEVFDLWAANLFSALAARVDPSSGSRINCGIGRFTLKDGILTDRGILLDTTRVRVQGSGRANFHDETISMRLQPQPKQAQFFSLATPIEVSGDFEHPKIGVSPGDVLATAGRLATSLLWVPLQKLIGKELPADGADVCSLKAPLSP